MVLIKTGGFMKTKLFNSFLILCILGLSACSTTSKNSKEATYRVMAKVWIDGELTSGPSVAVLENEIGEVSSYDSLTKESHSLKVKVDEKKSDLFLLDAAYTHTRGAEAVGENMKFKAKFGAPITHKVDNRRFEFKVIKL